MFFTWNESSPLSCTMHSGEAENKMFAPAQEADGDDMLFVCLFLFRTDVRQHCTII